MLEGQGTARGLEALAAWSAALVESSDDAIIGKTLAGEITSWNAAAELMYGYTAAEAVGRHISILAPPGYQDEFDEVLAAIARGERVRHLETVRQRKDGELVDVWVTISPIRDADGRIIAASTIERDNTARKRAERATAHLAAIVDSSDDAILAETLDGRIVSWNEGAERLYGYSADEAIGQHISILSLPEQSREMERLLARVAAGQGVSHFETTRRRKDGGLVDVSLTVSPIRNRHGEVVGASAIGRDIGDRKAAERARERVLANLEEAQRVAKVGSWTWDPRIDAATWSAQMYDIFGRDPSKDPATADAFFEYVHPEDRARVSEGYSRVFGGGRLFEVDYRIVSGGGEQRVLHALGRADPSRPGCYLGTVQDVTDQRAAEATLRDAEEHFRRAFEEAPIGMALISLEERLECANRALGEVCGRRPDELEGVPLHELVHPDDLERASEALRAVATGEERHLAAELRMIAPAGATVQIALHATMVRFRTGQPDRLLCQFQDLTARKRLERQREQAQRLDSLGQLAGGVAHDFNNLLGVVSGYASFVVNEIKARARLTREEWQGVLGDLAEIQRAAERATRLARQLLVFGRREIAQPIVLSVNELVLETERLLEGTLGQNIELVTRLAEDLSLVRIDPGQLEQVLINLAANAQSAMPDGGKLLIETENVVVDAKYLARHPALKPGPHVRLRLSDTGVGMGEHVLERAFEPFFTTKPDGHGTGLGLATVHGIVAQAGGDIEIDSTPGAGTTASVLLPAVDQPAPAPARGGRPARDRSHPTVLVVDDEDGVRELTRRILARNGYQVLVARSGNEAIRLADEHDGPIDLLVTDVVMPQMPGKEVAERITKLRSETRVLYMSGYAQPVLAAQGSLQPGVALLDKPFSESLLLAKVSEVFEAPMNLEFRDFGLM